MPEGSMSTLPNEHASAPSVYVPSKSREIAEVEAAMVVGKRFPRDVIKVIANIINECSRLRLAEVATYQYARGGTDIVGPSIRLAEVLAQSWGNIQYGVRELEQRDGESVCESFCWDIERNVRSSKTFTVPHVRDTKRGRITLTDSRDIYETVANYGARRLRACILGVIPGDVVEEALAACEKTLKAKVDVTPELLTRMVAEFAAIGVTRGAIETHIQRRIESITPAQVLTLRRIYTSIKDGMSSVEDWFAVETVASTEQPAPDKPKADEPAKPVTNGNAVEVSL